MRSAVLICVTMVASACTSTASGPRLELPPGPQIAGEGGGPEVYRREDGLHHAAFPIMGTRCELTLGTSDRALAASIAGAALAELRRIDAVMSEWRSDSEVSRVNASAGVRPVAAGAELRAVVSRALEAAALSGGAFDPTWAGMRGLWRFGDAMEGVVPDDEAIERARAKVDWRRVVVDDDAGTIFLREKGMALGLGGIAKGHAVDRLAAIVRAAGIRDFTVRLGGDLYASGRPWTVGIQDPRRPDAIVAMAELADQAFSTSGDYERYFVKDGVRYHHLIDPATGRPATASRSVTALCPDATTAEVVTKPVFIFGPERGIPYATSQGCEVAVIDAAGRLHSSPGLEARLRVPDGGGLTAPAGDPPRPRASDPATNGPPEG